MVENDLLNIMKGINSSISSLKFSPSGEVLGGVFDSQDRAGFFLLNPISGEYLKVIRTSIHEKSSGIAFFPNSKYLCTAQQNKLIIWDLNTWKKIKKLNHKLNKNFTWARGITSFTISPNEEIL